jgi:GntR family transcriptional regulator, transcriptional repressor for pyruvate dehydrogenase complex
MPEPSAAAPAYGVFARDMLPERIASRLLSLISERQLRPGDRLPAERELAAAMQVSRPSLREALRALAMMNIVEIRQGSGTYVSSLKPELLVEHLDFVFALDDSTFTELLEARQMLEPGIAAAAAQLATEEDLARLRACIDRVAAAVDDPEAFLEADLELHAIITAAAHNQIMARFMASLTRLGMASRGRTVALPGVRAQSLHDHQALVDALLRRDSAAAAAIMRDHLDHIHATLAETYAAHDGAEINPEGGRNVTDHHVG